MSNKTQKVISPEEFFSLPEVITQQNLQKTAKRFGDEQHRNAHIRILEIAKEYDVETYFESIEEYDK
jgi:hypothetical protein